MDIDEIKTKMLQYRDDYGQELLDSALILRCKTKKELESIIDCHSSHIEQVSNDAVRNISLFKDSLISRK